MKELQISILQEKNNTLHGVIWATDEQPKAVLQITHGMTEHIQRYKELAENLNKYGIVVAGFDLRGHGRNLSNRNCSSLGENGWEQSLNDIKIFSDFLHNKFPNCPHYILGFSLIITSLSELLIFDFVKDYQLILDSLEVNLSNIFMTLVI